RPDENRRIRNDTISPRFFETMGMPMLMGRGFGPQDDEHSPKVAVINEAMASYYFGQDNPIGKRFGWGDAKNSVNIEIVGVVKDAKYGELKEQTPHLFYLPAFQREGAFLNSLEVRTEGDPTAMIGIIQQEIKSVDGNLPIRQITTLSRKVDE